MVSFHFLSFGDSVKYQHKLEKIGSDIRSLGSFENIFIWNENDLSEELKHHQEFIQNNHRGYGYWIWKPIAIKKLCH